MVRPPRVPRWLIPLNLVLLGTVWVLVARAWINDFGLPREQMLALRLVREQIEHEYVDPANDQDLFWAALEGMVSSLDDHSEFIRPAAVGSFEDDTTGSYAGIGVVMAIGVTPITVEFPFADGPAERAGLHPGDQIIAVDGEPLVAENDRELRALARTRMLGPVGSSVRLTIRREATTFDCTIERGRVNRGSVKWERLLDAEHGIGYLHLSSFVPDSASELDAAIKTLQAAAPAGLRAVVLDLRFNRGGLLEQAIAIANLFLPSGTIVTLKRRGIETERHEAVPERCAFPTLPLVLLVDQASASASEVVAGALQDNHRATLVGMRTFGKGVVQSIYRWAKLDFRLKLTTAHYYTPNGRSIERRHRRAEDGVAEGGIEPDRLVPMTAEARAALQDVLNDDSEVPAKYRDEVRALADRLKIEVAAPPGPSGDPQLAAALAAALDISK